MKYSTLTENIRKGRIPRRFLTRTPGRVFMTGDQIVRLLGYFAEVDWDAQAIPVPRGARPHTSRSAQRKAS